MFHERGFMRQLHESKAPKILVYAMYAMAERFSNQPHYHDIARGQRGKLGASAVESLIQQYITTPSLETVQALILIGYYYGGEGNTKAKHIYSGLARLHAEALGMPDIPNGATIMRQEEYRRTWLSVHIASHWTATDMSIESVSFTHGPEYTPLEVDDVAFASLDPDPPQTTSPCNMWAQMAKTLEIFNKTSALLRRLSQSLIPFSDYCMEATKLENSLDEWEQNLPPNLQYNMENILSSVKNRLGRTFLAMHIGRHHFRQMLFFPFLDARSNRNTPNFPQGAAQCKQSANTVSEIIKHSTDIEGCDLNYFIYGHIAVISSCVHLHALLFSDNAEELAIARQRLVSNFEYLMRIKSYWPVVDHSVARLRKFQNSCQDAISDPFVLDNWMSRFLTEHSSDLSERQMPATQPEAGTEHITTRHTSADIDSTADNLKIPGPSHIIDHMELSSGVQGLSDLLHDEQVTSEALVNHAIDWLLE
ncbi:uncharacterized protein N7446_008860 [Penicillium canescens]|uniref:Xylanolytic transcriptional activator regulatory domain-containing protein n=1 Tax=Penicillium canescens TaxID=5083 RepID=A0AAD6IQG9_PENCN|nr:uncharacterized protein N7446_008860 [Penicillium canescens]KAJ6032846.1 hypothetical protein N7444_010617 [Penicillium canescens]KAJ6057962.1 hypothetical protein N7460_001236 [Penicillium canescens]KAJ6059277.1 hypothetical protein N7446_008860 [Penicillium canescens]